MPRPKSAQHRPSGLASLPDCFFLDRFAIGLRWATAQTCLGPEPAAASGTEAHRRLWRMKVGEALGIRRSSHRMQLCEFPGG